MLAKLAAFKAAHGHCRVPTEHPADPKLRRWVGYQRAYKKRLDARHPKPWITAERVAKLEALGFEWSPPRKRNDEGRTDEPRWEVMRATLAAFKAEHVHSRVPRNHPTDPKLGTWVDKQRTYKKRLDAGEPNLWITAERVAKLEALGFEWSLSIGGGYKDEVGWEAMRARLAAFQAAHGHCRVPTEHTADPKLGSWISNQRKRKKKMTVERVAKLEAVGFEWDARKRKR